MVHAAWAKVTPRNLTKGITVTLYFMEVYHDTCSAGWAMMILRGVGGAAKHRFSYLEKRAKKG